jgi:uncharacterized membrane protein YfcA
MNQADEQIKAVVRIYAVFGMGCAAVMFMKTWLEELKKPVTANLLAALFFIAVAADALTQALRFHTARAFGICLPMAAIALCGMWHCARKLAKIGKEIQDAKNKDQQAQDDVPTVPRAD